MKKNDPQTRLNQNFFFAIFIGIVILSFLVLKPYLSFVVLAFLLTALYNPIFRLIKKFVRFDSVASMLSVLVMFISILIPVTIVGYLSYNQVLEFNDDIQTFLKANNITGDDSSADTTEITKKSALEQFNERFGDADSNDEVFVKVDEEGNVEEVNKNEIGGINVNEFIKKINDTLHKIPFMEDKELTREEVDNFVGDVVGPASNFLANQAIKLGGSSIKIITNAIVFIMLLLTMFPSHKRLESYYKRISPLDDEIDESYIRRITDMGIAMIKGTFVVAFFQGILSGLFLWIAGVEYVVFWALLSTFVSIIPLGAGIINIPIAIALIITGNIWQGIMIILGNILVVGQVDTVLRPRLVPKDAAINPTLTLLSILGGVQLFGPLGFIYGPIVIIILMTTIEVYMKHYKNDKTMLKTEMAT